MKVIKDLLKNKVEEGVSISWVRVWIVDHRNGGESFKINIWGDRWGEKFRRDPY